MRIGKGVDRIGDEEIAAVTEVLRDQRLFRYQPGKDGSRVDAFEAAACAAFTCRYALATSSGTAALRCALAALGVGPGDEVVVPAFTFIATVSAVVASGATPVFAEVDDTLTLDPADVADKVTDRTAAIVPVHLENVCADMDALLAVAPAVPVLEDAAQAIGATYRGRAAGTIGAMGALSLQETKNITTGEGGLVLTDDEDLYVRAARYHDQGGQFVTQYRGERGPERGEPFMGDNLRMTEIAGAIGTVQLGRLPSLITAMRTNCARIERAIGAIDGLVPRRIPDPSGAVGSSLTWFAPTPDIARNLVRGLRAERIPAAQMYEGQPVYASPAIASRRTAAAPPQPWPPISPCPRTEALVARSLTVAIGPAYTKSDCEAVARAFEKMARQSL